MTTSNKLIHLIKQDLKRSGRRKHRIPKQWWLIYLAVIFLFAVIVATYTALHGTINLKTIWYFTFFVPFAVFGITIGVTLNEWKGGTVGWWLSLPYPRLTLVFSKFCAGLIRGLLLILAIYVIVALFGLYILLLNGHFQASEGYISFLLTGWQWFAFLVCLSPFMASFGLLYSVFRESKARNILPIFWFGWGTMWWLFSSLLGKYFTVRTTTGFNFSMHAFYIVLGSWIFAYICIRISAYIVDRQLAL